MRQRNAHSKMMQQQQQQHMFCTISTSLSRLLSEEDCALLGRPAAFTPGTSLIQVAVRFQSEDVLALLLTSGRG